jgi:DNA invertase Pin-like site-specific DNA recombinase
MMNREDVAMQLDGESLGTQQRVIEGYAMMNGLPVDAIFIERGVSGSKPLGERPEGARLLAALKAGDVVITPKLDRMFRSALNALDVLGQLKDRGVSLHMIDLGGDVTGNGISKLVFTILSAVAAASRRAPSSTSPRRRAPESAIASRHGERRTASPTCRSPPSSSRSICVTPTLETLIG